MRDLVELRNFYQEYIAQDDLVLCTLVRKSGSSYRDVGAKKIVACGLGKSAGLMSGGCLEASIEKMARDRRDDLPFLESFSTLSDEDRLMGYQTGCQGVIEILFEKMNLDNLNLLIPFGSPALAGGVRVVIENGIELGERKFCAREEVLDPAAFFEPWIQPIHLVIVGCGPDADAYVGLAKSLGWTIQFLDYRRDHAFHGRFGQEQVEHVELFALARRIPQGPKVAVVLMTHNYEADLEIMRGLRDASLGYLGCLGPAARYTRLKNDLAKMYEEEISSDVEDVVSAPAGIFSHSRSPNEIALSIVAQIQEKLVECTTEKVWTLILAAGASSRYGGAKALARFQGQSFLEKAVQTAQRVSGKNVLLVTGGHAEKLAPLIEVDSVYNNDWTSGMGTSIACGVQSIQRKDRSAEIILVLPVDQPLITPSHLKQLAQESYRSQKCTLTMDAHGIVGSPAAIPRVLFPKTQQLAGDRGMKSILQKSEMAIIENAEAMLDVDSPEDLSRLEELVASGGV